MVQNAHQIWLVVLPKPLHCYESVIQMNINTSVCRALVLVPYRQLSTSQAQLAIIGRFPWLSWERSKSTSGHRLAALPPIRGLSFHGAGAGGGTPYPHLVSWSNQDPPFSSAFTSFLAAALLLPRFYCVWTSLRGLSQCLTALQLQSGGLFH